ncbi:hypothetical protein COCCADRAFT_91736, partial [Bipolaris zeicola 26-R-13]
GRLLRLKDPDDVEILVLSYYYMNSGLNLHQLCHDLHAYNAYSRIQQSTRTLEDQGGYFCC